MKALSEPTTGKQTQPRTPVNAGWKPALPGIGPSRQSVVETVPYKPLESTVPCLVLLAIAVFTAYAPVLFNFFVGDDFVHLVWLKDAIHNPELVLRNFHASWLDVPTTKFYRPLISVFMLTDYAIWRTNGLGFHLTNVIFLLISSVSIFFIVRNLIAKCTNGGTTSNLCPLLAALIFGLYPLHPEPVSWITGRVDAVVTAFYLLSLWCYMRWRDGRHPGAAILSWLAMVLALCSKEMAITLPALFLSYELFVSQASERGSLVKRALQLIKPTLPFWLTLVAYFGVRRIALGTFVGGYDDSLFFIANPKAFVLGWVHGLHMLLVPVNRELISRTNVFAVAWQICLGVCSILTVSNMISDSVLRRRIFFLISWFAIALAPVYKLFAISDDLQGSRLAFLATAPLACLIGMSYAKINVAQLTDAHHIRYQPIVSLLAYLLLPVCAFTMLSRNNTAWAEAGAASNAIRASLHNFYTHIPGDPQVLLIGLPDTIHGAYVSRNAIPGMTSAPQLDRDIHNCLMIGNPEQIVPFGYLKRSIPPASNKLAVLSWNASKEQFDQISPDGASDATPLSLSGADLAFHLHPVGSSCKITVLPDGAVDVQSAPDAAHPSVSITANALNCFNTDFISIDLNDVNARGTADLFYTNGIVPAFDLRHRSHADFGLSGESDHTLLFALHADPIWTFGGTSNELKLQLPRQSHVRIISIAAVSPSKLMPQVSFPNSGVLGTKGYAHLSQADHNLVLQYDAALVPGCAGVEWELARPNTWFEQQNTSTPTKIAMKQISCRARFGAITLKRDFFPQPGIYELRPWAVNANGKRIGVAGDHITISVDS